MIEPYPNPIVVTQHGHAWLPSPNGDAHGVYMKINAGLTIGWAPMPEVGAVLLVPFAGVAGTVDLRDGFATTLSVPGLHMLIADLQAIAAQLQPTTTDGD